MTVQKTMSIIMITDITIMVILYRMIITAMR